jgi:Holliday junction resolvase RusA-like endonuclease
LREHQNSSQLRSVGQRTRPACATLPAPCAGSARLAFEIVSEHFCTIDVNARPATFATAHEARWKAAVREAISRAGVAPRLDACFSVRIVFRTPVPRTVNDRWDLDNLVKPTLDAMEGIFGLRAWKGHPQPNDDRVTHLEASKRTVIDREREGARIEVWLV